MRKKEDEELGMFITREIKAMMINEALTYEQRTKLFCAIVADEPLDDGVMTAFAESLKTGYKAMNERNKANIAARRERQKEYQRNLRSSTEIDKDEWKQATKKVDRRALPTRENRYIDNIPLNPPSGVEGSIPKAISVEDIVGEEGKTEHSSAIGTEREGGGGQGKTASVQQQGLADRSGETTASVQQQDRGGDETEELKAAAGDIADEIETTDAWGRMRVNRGKLMKCLVATLKKNGGAAGKEELVSKLIAGLKAWTVTWQSEEWRYAPARITDWIYDGKYLETPRKPKREEAAVGAGCGECGVEIV